MIQSASIERPLVLASASPRRRELMGLLGMAFSARVAQVEEQIHSQEMALEAAQRFARQKAAAVAQKMNPASYALVIGADTIVALDGEPLGKPRDAAEAEVMLRKLRGRKHQVFTALSLVSVPTGQSWHHLAETDVPMRDYSDEEIYLYVRSGDPFDKAGAYAIQNHDFRPVTNMQGCYANVMGLPLCHLTVLLRQQGVEPLVDVPQACQERLAYRCPVYARVLAGEPA